MRRIRMLVLVVALALFPTVVDMGIAEADVGSPNGPTRGGCFGGWR